MLYVIICLLIYNIIQHTYYSKTFNLKVAKGKTMISNDVYKYIYTGCPRRNVPNFGRVFLRLKYTDITQNTNTQS